MSEASEAEGWKTPIRGVIEVPDGCKHSERRLMKISKILKQKNKIVIKNEFSHPTEIALRLQI